MLTIPNVVQSLRERIGQIEGSQARREPRPVLTSGWPQLDRHLAGGGLPAGALTEWHSDREGLGSYTLALTVAGLLLHRPGACTIVDTQRMCYPPALPLPLERVLLIRPTTTTDALWAWEQALKCPGVLATVGTLGDLSDKQYRRLQLRAESGGGIGMIVRPPGYSSAASWAALIIQVEALATDGTLEPQRRRYRLHIRKGHAGLRRAPVEVECP